MFLQMREEGDEHNKRFPEPRLHQTDKTVLGKIKWLCDKHYEQRGPYSLPSR